MKPGSTDSTARPSGILVEIRQGGRLLAALPLGSDPIEVTLRDIQSGLPLGTLSARGPQVGVNDETPVPRLARVPDDDFTMPLPESTDTFSRAPTEEATGDLDGDAPDTETAEVPRSARSRDRRVPNLAQNIWTDASDEATSPAIAPTLLPDPDDESSLTIPRPTAIAATGPEETLSAHLIDAVAAEESVSLHLEPVPVRTTVPPAEVWTRNASEWRSAGRLVPGGRATARRGWVSLELDGRLIVSPGPELAGTATLVDGSTIEIRKGGQRVRLPAGSSVILRGTGHGLYVRADPPHPSH